MYRIFLCILLANFVSCHRNWGQNHHSHCNHRHHEYKRTNGKNDFYDLSWDVVRQDRKAQRICDFSTNATKETFFADSYKLSVPLSGFEEENISVKLRHRVIFIEAYKASERKLFNSIKVLPEFVKGSDASWVFADEVLEISIPYKFTVGQERVKICDEAIDESEKVIPKSDNIDVRFGSPGDTTTAAPVISDNIV